MSNPNKVVAWLACGPRWWRPLRSAPCTSTPPCCRLAAVPAGGAVGMRAGLLEEPMSAVSGAVGRTHQFRAADFAGPAHQRWGGGWRRDA